MNIYVASSWRNPYQPEIVRALRGVAHVVYDFRHPAPGDDGFHWSAIDEDWESWTHWGYLDGLEHPLAENGFAKDFQAMKKADGCVLVLPCGRSAHLEAGWFKGAEKPLIIVLIGAVEPELMYKMADTVCGGRDLETALPSLMKAVREIGV